MTVVEHDFNCSTMQKFDLAMRKLKKVFFAAILTSAAAGCSPKLDYEGGTHELSVTAVYPAGSEKWAREGVEVTFEDAMGGTDYTALTDGKGTARILLPNGSYGVRISDVASDSQTGDEYVFNGAQEKVILVDSDRSVTVNLTMSVPGKIVVKEIYSSGCPRYPLEGTYQADKYIVLHNNSQVTQYLDGLCFGVVDPYNSTASNVWISRDPASGQVVYPEFAPVIQAVWQFPGSGHEHALSPGEDAVLVVGGAIDHTGEFPLSVNLNNSGYFVCYNNVAFWNPAYHPSPGDRIQDDHIMNLLLKMGQANAFTFSINSPAVVLFRPSDGTTMTEFLQNQENIVQKPGSSADRIVKVPLEWVEDGVEVFTNNVSGSTKRLNPVLDAGYVRLSESFQGRSLYRRVNESETRKRGYEVLMDTNNSSADFYESERNGQSLRKK